MTNFGSFLKERREAKELTQRKLATLVGCSPGHIARLETEEGYLPNEEMALDLARVLEVSPEVMLAMTGRVSKNLVEIICKRPQLFSQLIRDLEHEPDHALLRISREVKDGKW